MEIEPSLANEHLVEIFSKLPDATLAAEEARIRATLSELAGKLVTIIQVRSAQ